MRGLLDGLLCRRVPGHPELPPAELDEGGDDEQHDREQPEPAWRESGSQHSPRLRDGLDAPTPADATARTGPDGKTRWPSRATVPYGDG